MDIASHSQKLNNIENLCTNMSKFLFSPFSAYSCNSLHSFLRTGQGRWVHFFKLTTSRPALRVRVLIRPGGLNAENSRKKLLHRPCRFPRCQPYQFAYFLHSPDGSPWPKFDWLRVFAVFYTLPPCRGANAKDMQHLREPGKPFLR